MERFGRPGRLCDLPETGEGENGVRGARVGERFRKEGMRKGPSSTKLLHAFGWHIRPMQKSGMSVQEQHIWRSQLCPISFSAEGPGRAVGYPGAHSRSMSQWVSMLPRLCRLYPALPKARLGPALVPSTARPRPRAKTTTGGCEGGKSVERQRSCVERLWVILSEQRSVKQSSGVLLAPSTSTPSETI